MWYTWEVALNVGLDSSFDNLYSRKGIREKTRDVNSAKAYITSGEIFWRIFNGRVSLVLRDLNYEVILREKYISASDIVNYYGFMSI